MIASTLKAKGADPCVEALASASDICAMRTGPESWSPDSRPWKMRPM